ncbi:MAG: FecR domain-containing protein, partial [Oscillospiraceae bacterium]|nr:FecR domain-containing protein [Oscillospiraceae bacterium]
MKRLLTALITALLVLQISAPAYAAYEARSIVISGVEGRDVSMTKGTAKTFAAKANMKLADGYTVSTGTASYCTLKLDNDTLVRIDQKSKIQVSKVSGKKLAVSILSGAVKVDAGPQKDGDTIEVKAGNSALAIRGTLFVAENVPDGDAGAFMVTMLEGSGSVNGHILLAGQTMYVYDASEDKLHEVSDFDITGGSLFVLETIMEHWEELSEALDVLSFTFDELSDKAEELREAAASAPEPPAVTQSVTRTESTQSGGQGGTQGGQGAQGGTQDGQGGQDNTQGGAQGGGQGAQGGGQTPIPAISIAAIPGLTAPVAGAEPVGYVATAQYTGIVTWWPPVADTFEHDTAYIAMVTLTPRPGYTLTGVAANFFTAAGAEASNPANSGVVTAVFPATEPAPDTVISIAAIPGLTAPVAGAAPVESIIDTAQYTGTVTWSPPVTDTFERDTAYTATVTLTPAAGYTLEGVSENFFTVAGAEASNPANSGDVTAVFPAAERRGVTLKLLSAIQQVPEASPTSPPPYYTEHTETSLGDMAEVTLDDVKTAMGEVLEGYVITGFMTENDPGAELHTSTSISGTATTLYVRVDGRGDMRFPKWIYSPGDLDRVRNGLHLNYLMMANISTGTLSSFEPIGADDDPFTGTFDGGGKTIYDLKIETTNFAGLFGVLGYG